jgi:predicted nucleic acid-binding protein
VILDTGAISALLANDRSLLELLRPIGRLLLPAIALGEYRFGLERSRLRIAIEPRLNELEAQSDVLAVGAETARVYGRIREGLRAAGTPIPENDIWIAALALEHGQPVVSRDGHFDRVPGLKRVGW